LAAATFTRQAARLERETVWEPLSGATKQEVSDEHRGYVIGAVVCAAAFLEAVINEAFADATESHTAHLGNITSETIRRLALRWKTPDVRRRMSIRAKFQLFLKECGFSAGQSERPRSEDVQLLLSLRNALVHYVPEWRAAAIAHDTTDDWTRMLKGRFSENPFTGAGNPFFPDKCLSHGCAEWAVQSALTFADSFYQRFQGQPPYRSVREEIVNKDVP
jgi:hypothetical protein